MSKRKSESEKEAECINKIQVTDNQDGVNVSGRFKLLRNETLLFKVRVRQVRVFLFMTFLLVTIMSFCFKLVLVFQKK